MTEVKDRVERGERVIITRPFVTLLTMQVCVVEDATDEEILSICNKHNKSGTSAGWGIVINSQEDADNYKMPGAAPGKCTDYLGRVHKIVMC